MTTEEFENDIMKHVKKSITHDYLKSLIEDARLIAPGGVVADYNPELRIALKNKIGLTVHYTDDVVVAAGNHHGVRDLKGKLKKEARKTDDMFTIQSISKVFALLYVLEEIGEDIVCKRMGKEPTGDPFNADPRVRKEGGARIPYNPLINVGAIFITSLFPGNDRDDRFNRFFDFVKKMCSDNDMVVDEAVYESEKATGHNNRSLAWKMNADGIIIDRTKGKGSSNEKGHVQTVMYIEDVLDNYFKQCSILANCDHLARAACVLASGGKDPVTKRQIIRKENVKIVLSLMTTCGLYDYSGSFGINVGIPAISGVSGGILAVVPKRMGICTFSPLLDYRGNSVRGMFMLEELSNKYNLSLFSNPTTKKTKLKIFKSEKELNKLINETKSVLKIPGNYRPASYIPELAKANAKDICISICSINGEIISTGKHQKSFTMQSISTLFSLLYSLNNRAEGFVFENVGLEPTGEPFNKIKWKNSEDGQTKRQIPFNPMINAGAIIVASMIPNNYSERTENGFLNIDDFLAFVRKLCGNEEISINEIVFESERRTGFNNRSLAWLMNDRLIFNDILSRQGITTINNEVIEDILGVYFQLCSIEVTCKDLARFAAILANGGRDTQTQQFLLNPRFVKIVTSLMLSSGLYDESGDFACKVGIPSISGISGGIVSVVPGKFGIATYNPILNMKGNSEIGMQLLHKISREEELSIFST